MIRQGDVLLVPVADAGTGNTPRADADIVLAEGEVTGHRHFMAAGTAAFLREGPGVRQCVVGGGTTALLRHDEHDPVPVVPKIYDLPRQYEYTAGDMHQVTD